jgi:hypothetical protein
MNSYATLSPPLHFPLGFLILFRYNSSAKMPNTEFGLEKYLNPAGQQTMGSAIEKMRRVGSSVLQQEHLMMVFSGMYPHFSRIGAGPDFFDRRFGVDPATARYTGDFTVAQDLRDVVTSAAILPNGKTTRRAGPLHLLEAALEHHSGRLRAHILHAYALHSGEFDEDIPDNLWQNISGQRDQRETHSSVA